MALVYVDNWKLPNNNGRISDGYQLEMNSIHRPGPKRRPRSVTKVHVAEVDWMRLCAFVADKLTGT